MVVIEESCAIQVLNKDAKDRLQIDEVKFSPTAILKIDINTNIKQLQNGSNICFTFFYGYV